MEDGVLRWGSATARATTWARTGMGVGGPPPCAGTQGYAKVRDRSVPHPNTPQSLVPSSNPTPSSLLIPSPAHHLAGEAIHEPSIWKREVCFCTHPAAMGMRLGRSHDREGEGGLACGALGPACFPSPGPGTLAAPHMPHLTRSSSTTSLRTPIRLGSRASRASVIRMGNRLSIFTSSRVKGGGLLAPNHDLAPPNTPCVPSGALFLDIVKAFCVWRSLVWATRCMCFCWRWFCCVPRLGPDFPSTADRIA